MKHYRILSLGRNWPTFLLYGLFGLFLVLSNSCRQQDTAEVDPSTLKFVKTDNVAYINLPAEPKSLNPFLTTQGYADTSTTRSFKPSTA
ncbi:MAG: hypothetical protein HC821_05665 [Lewinella sp.]|nr:hypothetical protein [Lewinella sp.]